VRAQLRLPRLRVAVVDTGDGDAAGQDGDQLRCFGDTRSALRWLNDGVPGGMRPAPAVFSGRAPLAILGG
jgi:hypothetical protein